MEINWKEVTKGDLETELRAMYIDEKMSLEKMEQRLCISRKPLTAKMRELGIPIRTPKGFLKNLHKHPGFLTKPRKQIAREVGCSVNTVGMARTKYRLGEG